MIHIYVYMIHIYVYIYIYIYIYMCVCVYICRVRGTVRKAAPEDEETSRRSSLAHSTEPPAVCWAESPLPYP